MSLYAVPSFGDIEEKHDQPKKRPESPGSGDESTTIASNLEHSSVATYDICNTSYNSCDVKSLTPQFRLSSSTRESFTSDNDSFRGSSIVSDSDVVPTSPLIALKYNRNRLDPGSDNSDALSVSSFNSTSFVWGEDFDSASFSTLSMEIREQRRLNIMLSPLELDSNEVLLSLLSLADAISVFSGSNEILDDNMLVISNTITSLDNGILSSSTCHIISERIEILINELMNMRVTFVSTKDIEKVDNLDEAINATKDLKTSLSAEPQPTSSKANFSLDNFKLTDIEYIRSCIDQYTEELSCASWNGLPRCCDFSICIIDMSHKIVQLVAESLNERQSMMFGTIAKELIELLRGLSSITAFAMGGLCTDNTQQEYKFLVMKIKDALESILRIHGASDVNVVSSSSPVSSAEKDTQVTIGSILNPLLLKCVFIGGPGVSVARDLDEVYVNFCIDMNNIVADTESDLTATGNFELHIKPVILKVERLLDVTKLSYNSWKRDKLQIRLFPLLKETANDIKTLIIEIVESIDAVLSSAKEELHTDFSTLILESSNRIRKLLAFTESILAHSAEENATTSVYMDSIKDQHSILLNLLWVLLLYDNKTNLSGAIEALTVASATIKEVVGILRPCFGIPEENSAASTPERFNEIYVSIENYIKQLSSCMEVAGELSRLEYIKRAIDKLSRLVHDLMTFTITIIVDPSGKISKDTTNDTEGSPQRPARPPPPKEYHRSKSRSSITPSLTEESKRNRSPSIVRKMSWLSSKKFMRKNSMPRLMDTDSFGNARTSLQRSYSMSTDSRSNRPMTRTASIRSENDSSLSTSHGSSDNSSDISSKRKQSAIKAIPQRKKSVCTDFTALIATVPGVDPSLDFRSLLDRNNIIFMTSENDDPYPPIRAASLPMLIERLISHEYLNPDFTKTFLLTYRSFTTPKDLFDLLIARFNTKPDSSLSAEDVVIFNTQTLMPIRVRIFNFFKHWLDTFFSDFLFDGLLDQLKSFLKNFEDSTLLSHHELLFVNLTKNIRAFISKKWKQVESDEPLYDSVDLLNGVSSRVEDSALKVTDMTPYDLACQLTLIVFDMFQRINPTECLNKAWNTEGLKRQAPNIIAMIVWFNNISAHVTVDILSHTSAKNRAVTIKFYLSTMSKLRSLNNFNCVTAVLAGVTSSAVLRLKRTWSLISQRWENLMSSMQTLMDASHNYSTYRRVLHTSKPPVIPFLGMYLTDLTFIDEGNPDTIRNPDSVDLINFDKRRRVAEVIREMKQYQMTPYSLIESKDISIRGIFEKHVSETPDAIYNRSLILEPREQLSGGALKLKLSRAS